LTLVTETLFVAVVSAIRKITQSWRHGAVKGFVYFGDEANMYNRRAKALYHVATIQVLTKIPRSLVRALG